MSQPLLIRHIHLPSITPFNLASRLQSRLVAEHLTYKALSSSLTRSTSIPLPPPPPHTILTFTPTPTYTTGRRELQTPLSPAQVAALKAPLPPLPGSIPSTDAFGEPLDISHAAIIPTRRGGLITFHGPGQVVIYTILDLARLSLHSSSSSSSSSPSCPSSLSSPPSPSGSTGLSARCFIHLLESTTIRTLMNFSIPSTRTTNPGVWIDEGRKIAALGTHLRRRVSAYGVGLNVCTDLRWFERIVGCGLVGKGAVGVKDVLAERGTGLEEFEDLGTLESVGRLWVREFAGAVLGEEGVGMGMVEEVSTEETLEILRQLKEEEVLAKEVELP